MTATSLPQRQGFSEIDLAEIVQSAINALQVLALNPHSQTLLCADGNEKGPESLSSQLSNGLILPHLHTGFQGHTQIANELDLSLDNFAGKTIGRYGQGEHASQPVGLFKDRHRIAFLRKIVCACQTGRTGSDNGDLVFFFNFDFRLIARVLRSNPDPPESAQWSAPPRVHPFEIGCNPIHRGEDRSSRRWMERGLSSLMSCRAS